MTKRVAILQSNYVPWKGYFDLIAAVDEFILYDDRQYTRRDWRNRNRIKTPQGSVWLTVPVLQSGRFTQSIDATRIDGHAWAGQHWAALQHNYARAPFFDEIAAWLAPLYIEARYEFLSDLNRALIEAICLYLGIQTRISNVRSYAGQGGQTERLLSVCQQAGAACYVSGPSARHYIEGAQFDAQGVELVWFDYQGYPAYPQLWGQFVHEVSILDLLFNCGPSASSMMKYVLK